MSSKTGYNKRTKKLRKINVINGVAHIKSSFNNTIITITDNNGNVLVSASGGTAGFKNSRESTPHAAKLAAEQVADKAKDFGLKFLLVNLKGPGAGKDSAVIALKNKGLEITSIKEVTGIPHNGCKPRKRRRV